MNKIRELDKQKNKVNKCFKYGDPIDRRIFKGILDQMIWSVDGDDTETLSELKITFVYKSTEALFFPSEFAALEEFTIPKNGFLHLDTRKVNQKDMYSLGMSDEPQSFDHTYLSWGPESDGVHATFSRGVIQNALLEVEQLLIGSKQSRLDMDFSVRQKIPLANIRFNKAEGELILLINQEDTFPSHQGREIDYMLITIKR